MARFQSPVAQAGGHEKIAKLLPLPVILSKLPVILSKAKNPGLGGETLRFAQGDKVVAQGDKGEYGGGRTAVRPYGGAKASMGPGLDVG